MISKSKLFLISYRRDLIRFLIIFLIFNLDSSLTLADQQLPNKPDSYKLSELKKPNNIFEILENLKLAITNQLLMNQLFFSNDNLLLFSQGKAINWFYHADTNELGRIDNIPFLQNPIWVSREKCKQLESDKEDLSKICSSILVEITQGDADIRIKTIKKFFGGNGQMSDALQNQVNDDNHVWPTISPTNEMGNKVMIYKFLGSQSQSTVKINFSFDGSVSNILLQQREK